MISAGVARSPGPPAMSHTLAVMLAALAGVANLAALACGRLNAAGTSRAIPWMQRSSSLPLAASAAWPAIGRSGRWRPPW